MEKYVHTDEMKNTKGTFEREGKQMKKKFLALLSLCMLCGCGGEEEKTFSLTTEEQQAYTAAIDGVMEEFYWEYDRASLSFSGATLPADGEENARLFDASADCEYNLKRKAGQDGVLAEAKLLHYNGDTAGTLQCWFAGDALVGVAYSGGYDKEYYSLKERNPFLADGGFQAYENWTGMGTDFVEGNGKGIVDPCQRHIKHHKQGNNHPVALVEEGDAIEIDINAYSIHLDVFDEELAKRKENWQSPKGISGNSYLARYAKMVSSADKGAILE